jgi:YVTN family beta-propeller protein
MGVRGIESEGAGGHTIAVFEVKTGQRISTIDTGIYDRPHGLASFAGRLYVTSESTRHLLVYDLETEALIRPVYLDQECAHMVGVSPDGSRAYTANILSNSLTAVDTDTLEVEHHIPVPERPEGMVFSPDGAWMYCVCREAKTVAVVDCSLGKMVDRIKTGHGPVRIAIQPDGRHLVVPLFHSAAVEILDPASKQVIRTIALGPHPAGTCLSPDGKLAFISCEDENKVYVLDLEKLEIMSTLDTGQGADAMVCLDSSECI